MTDKSNPPISHIAIQVRDLRKTFGFLEALRGIGFEVRWGEFLTIFGPNGAGKTTLIKVLAALTRPTAGSAIVAGHDVLKGSLELRKKIGVISHATCVYPDLTALENLMFYARMYGLDHPKDRVLKALEDVGLANRRHDRVHTYSRGMQQRLSIARAVIHDPSVLFLDEPFTGLDPHASRVLKEYLHSLHTEQRTILMTTHDISCGLEMSDTVAIQVGGKFAFKDSIKNVDPDSFQDLYFDAVAKGK